jgi:uncharacterized protein (DUF4415 family)
MSTLRFEWDERKATVNAKNHGVTFEEAQSVFFDERARSYASSPHARQPPMNRSLTRKRCPMRKEYEFAKSRKNPYASQLKKQITIRLDEDSITYFKVVSEEVGIPYQSLINLYLRDCAASNRKLDLNWK